MTRPTTPAPDTPTASSRAGDPFPFRYSARLTAEIEPKWQARWAASRVFEVAGPGDPGFDRAKPRFYCLDMFPYPSGAGLHVGHPEGYTGTDIICRYRRLRGCNVLHPMGWDAFGLPAEQHAIETGVHPAVTTRQLIETFRTQLQRFGFCYDWSREFATIDEGYYRWTQWIWLKAYRSWYDPDRDRARPIDELVDEFASGGRPVRYDPDRPPGFLGVGYHDDDLGAWKDLDERTRKRVLDTYRLAYLSEQMVNWCPKLGTALANEEVIDGKSERGGHPVHRKPLRQWMFRITAYAERLLRDLDPLDWPESTKIMQREWIGRSEGAEVDFGVPDPPKGYDGGALRVYTTRPDTIFGATFMVVAPEHPLVEAILDDPPPGADAAQIRAYVEAAARRSELDRMVETREKTGVFAGLDALNPATGERIPILIADYVLMGYGHGAIMAVPAHDERDFEFAKAYDLPIVQVVETPEGRDESTVYAGRGRGMNSANDGVSLNGLETGDAMRAICDWLERAGLGRRRINYKLRDWLFSRQRYWGEPFPVVYDAAGDHHPVDESRLPVVLPEMSDYHPVESDEPMPLLGKATEWINTTAGEAGVTELPADAPVQRETNTMPGWAGSCWYYLRFCDPRNAERFVSREAEAYWLGPTDENPIGGVDLYIGGAEHAVLHLLYARFWHKILYDLGEVSTTEPARRLFHQGMITSYAFQRADRSLAPADAVEGDDEAGYVETASGEPVTRVVAKMSKSLKNVVNPDDVIHEYGADAFRLYEMSMGPLEDTKPWNTRDLIGLFRFLQRTWRLFVDEETGERTPRVAPRAKGAGSAFDRPLHRAIAGVEEDIEAIRLNTAVAKLIILVNELVGSEAPIPLDVAERFLVILSPFAPHVAEELWSRLGHADTIAEAGTWPAVDESMLREALVELPVQVNGKVRGRVSVPADADEETVRRAALEDDRIRPLLKGKTVRKAIVVPGKIVNIVAG